MTLAKYQAKRKFNETPEPAGREKRSQGGLKFVVQKHAASHLHYDFRLEMEGVLKSWAVPKGPTLDPSIKRLAIMVEDHPLDYLRFEGTIPEGNYGAGEVLVWDIGTYWKEGASEARPQEKELLAGLAAGKLVIELNGKKLKGVFDLVKMHGRGENQWLLLKKDDKYASAADITRQDESAISKRRLADPPGAAQARAAAARKAEPKAGAKPARLVPAAEPKAGRQPRTAPAKPAAKGAAARRSPARPPYPLKPMLATLVDKPFDGDDWVFEVKWDGYRAIGQVERDGKEVKLYSRNAQPFNDTYPALVEALRGLGHDCVVDGEIVVLSAAGKSAFQLLQNYATTRTGEIRYALFDLLFLDGHDLRHVPLIERKQLLKQLIAAVGEPLVYSDHVAAKGELYFAAAEKNGLEGIIAKRADGPYRDGARTADWLKIKTQQRQEAVIAGFTQPRGSRKAFGALILGVYDGAKLRYIGHTGTGFDTRTLNEVHKRLLPLVTKTCPFSPVPKTNMPATWVRPRLLCEVSFTEWTGEGHMRHPVFVGLREDKPARQVKVEEQRAVEAVVGEPKAKATGTAQKAQPASKAGAKARTGGHKEAPILKTAASLTHLDKLYWEAEGISKGQLLAYYDSVAQYILPYLKDRPESMHRFPGGAASEGFYQKDVNFKLPPFVESTRIFSDSNNQDLTWALCQNRDSLLYLVNLGCIEINPWNSRVGALDNPDYTVLDLDPDDNSFDEVVAVAQTAHRILDKYGINACCKTSGKTGLHIFIPLGAKYSYGQAREFAHVIARLVHAQTRENTSLERSPAKRKGLIYLDYLQNSPGQTLAAPYSVRPAPGAPVSTPLKWSEVRKGLRPEKFTIFNTLERRRKVGDLWQPVLGKGIDLEAVLGRMGATAQAAGSSNG
jgi:bifunctional non-homologous end joining protein LigD